MRRGNPSGGEPIDRAAQDAIKLAHQALDRFPDVVRRHKFIAGGAAISSSLIVLAGVAITRRIRAGQTAEEAVASVTEEEVQGLRVVQPQPEDEEPSTEAAKDEPGDTSMSNGAAPMEAGTSSVESGSNGALQAGQRS